MAQQTPRSVIEMMDDLKRSIEEAKIAIESNAKSARILRALSLITAVLAIFSMVLMLSPYVLVSDQAHIVFSVACVVGFCFSIGISFGFSGEVRDKKKELSKHRDERKYKRIELENSGDGEWIAVLWSYHAEVASKIDDYRASARRYRTIHNRFQFFIIISSSLVTLMATASASIPQLTWGAAVLSFFVASATGITGYFKYRERAVNLQRTADDLEREYNSVDIGINDYARNSEARVDVVLRKFAEKAEEIKNEQRKREQQLEQSPEVRAGSSGKSNR